MGVAYEIGPLNLRNLSLPSRPPWLTWFCPSVCATHVLAHIPYGPISYATMFLHINLIHKSIHIHILRFMIKHVFIFTCQTYIHVCSSNTYLYLIVFVLPCLHFCIHVFIFHCLYLSILSLIFELTLIFIFAFSGQEYKHE